ncbi:hypothetical protein [Dysgonomonas sp. 25]|uniref:hypothetical protein n=1 Tax=Dysgonomonas sp. 25 TaxID=2302933 RepID=UPI0013D7B67A|nr:hypothetical protein [Dysgonomonas sp. 25]NDV68608.1 hypothetical protein [Dysgonomonas sp. 25]
MKTIYTLLLINLLAISISAQGIDCVVCDINDKPLEMVEAKNIRSNKICFSDKNGTIKLDGNNSDTIIFILNGYSPTELTINNILHSQNTVYLFPQMQLTLSEVTITPIDIYAIYEKAVINLKDKLIKNKEYTYKCIGTEKEVNKGSNRNIEFLYTAKLKKANIKKSELDYIYMLSQLKSSVDSANSAIMQNNNHHISLSADFIRKDITRSEKNSFHISDSSIIIYNKSHDSGIIAYTINKEDTTLVGIDYELINSQKKYMQRRTFDAKKMYSSISIRYNKNDEGYYLHGFTQIYDTSFLLGKPQREERIICTYKTVSIDDDIKADLKFIPNTKNLYKMQNYGISDDGS